MKRKLIIGTMALFCMASAAKAQGFVTAKFGVKGGWNMANITNSKEGDIDDKKSLNTFNAGVIAAIPLGSTFEIRTGLDWQSKGIKSSSDVSDIKTTYEVNPSYIELPVNISIMLPINEKMKAYVGAGPYGAVGVAGKFKTEITTNGNTTSSSQNIKWGNDNPTEDGERKGTVGSGDFKRFDFGVNAIAGLDFGKFGIHAQYGFGLTNTVPGTSSNNNGNKNNQNRVLGVSGVFYF